MRVWRSDGHEPHQRYIALAMLLVSTPVFLWYLWTGTQSDRPADAAEGGWVKAVITWGLIACGAVIVLSLWHVTLTS